MNDRFDIVYLACYEKWWDWEAEGFVSRSAIVAHGLSRHPRVRRMLVVNPATSVWRDLSRGVAPRQRTAERDGVRVFDHVRLLPRETKWPLAYRLNAPLHDEAFVGSLQAAMGDWGMADAVIWMAGPLVAKYAEHFPTNPVVYDAVDEWTADPAQTGLRAEIRRACELIRDRADVVFAVSPTLARSFTGARPRVSIVPNGIDATRFEGAHPVPDDLAGIPGPRVGYVGVLQDRVDVGLVGRLATRMPGVSFVFVGPVLDHAHFAPVRSLPNVHFLGARRPELVPAYLSAFDACLLPHVRSELTENMDPLKLYEYLAAGKPVIATDVPLNQPPGLVRVAVDAASFEQALAEALAGRWKPDEALLNTYLTEASWDARLETMVEEVRRVTPSVADTSRWSDRATQSGGVHA